MATVVTSPDMVEQARRWCEDGTALGLYRIGRLKLRVIAFRCAVSIATASRWLHGQRLPTGERAARLGQLIQAELTAYRSGPSNT